MQGLLLLCLALRYSWWGKGKPLWFITDHSYKMKDLIKSRLQQLPIQYYIYFRCLMVSTNQADPSCFYFRISWILMEGCWFYFFRPLHLMQGLRSLEHWLLQKISMTILDQKFRFLIKKQVFLCSNISRTWISWPEKIQL